MVAEIIKIEQLCTPYVNFYTLKFEDKTRSEFADFYYRLSTNPANKPELKIILSVIEEIGERGAFKRYFNREENNAYALPPMGDEYYIETSDYGIRLYCVVLNQNIVFLLNGDRKKRLKATAAGSNVSRYFYMANSLHNKLIEERLGGYIYWDEENSLAYEDGYIIDVNG